MSGLLPLALFDVHRTEKGSVDLEAGRHQIEMVLADLGISAQIVSAVSGPVVAWYEIELAEGVEPVKVTIHARDFARALSATAFRVIEDAADGNRLTFEVPNATREQISLSDILRAEVFRHTTSVLSIVLGKDIADRPVVADLAAMPHLLIGSDSTAENMGFLQGVILSLLDKKTPDQLRLLLMDIKSQGFSCYQAIPHLLAPVMTEAQAGINALKWVIKEMERRIQLLGKAGSADRTGGDKDVSDGLETAEKLPRMVVVINGYPDLFSMGREAEMLLARIAMRGHQAGIHLVMATAQISFDTVTDLLRMLVPVRVAFKVRSMTDSRRMVDQNGAEALLGQGDMLCLVSGTGKAQRIHGASISDAEISRIADFLRHQGKPDYVDGVTGDND